jgi:poly-gamma-glutamate synthesis protein (capsule biosynthesis protein)
MQKRNFESLSFIAVFLLTLISGCTMPAKGRSSVAPFSTRHAQWQQTLTPGQQIADTHSPGLSLEGNQTEVTISQSLPVDEETLIFLHPGLPENLITKLHIPSNNLTDNQQDAEVRILLGGKNPDQAALPSMTWVYALVAPFYTLTDGLTIDALTAIWRGEIVDGLNITQILVSPEIHAVLSEILGRPNGSFVNTITKEALKEQALTGQPFLSLLPFEELTPHWKVLKIDGQSPIEDSFSPADYPLTAQIWLESDLVDKTFSLPATNYDPDLRTVLIMTGVTALVRATAHRMEIHGNTYPGTDVYPWLTSADLVHISNEVAFAENCPSPDPFQTDLIFCSSPDRIELLEYISADIIELSGNHLLDYGIPPINLTLEMYAERGWTTYAGGWDLLDARTPAKITHNGNQLAFIGCNPVGPPNAWATDTQPGSASCGDYQWLLEEVRNLHADGYLPIVTLQYAEDYTAYPSAQMEADFIRIADAGALIVNGSQAHTPKSMVFYKDSFLHYGLGNLFFDQMEVYYSGYLMQGTREGFIDRLVFYDGELISVELLTTMLEDYARPRPMSPSEREALLSRIFRISLDSYQ